MTTTAEVVCPGCSHVNPPGQKFCGGCGSPVGAGCPSCGAANPAGQRFCGSCGSPLPRPCPACGVTNPGGQKFCGNCGASLVAAAPAVVPDVPVMPTTVMPPVAASSVVVPASSIPTSPVEEERRLVTALFCDLVGFTPLSEALDPEEVREIQTMYFAQMNRELHRFGGTVEKYAGDAVLALFGAPLAHEDDAERAVRCALAMQQAFQPVAEMAKREWGVDLAVRIGVNTGEAISGAWDVEGRRDYSATGDVVNTAARLQSSADPGGVIVGPETMHLARRAILFGPRKDLTLKGKATAFPAYPVLNLREQMAERWETREQRAPLIGRHRELSFLMGIWDRVQAGEGRLVTLIAEAGVGKSRLLAEAVERMRRVAGTVTVRGRCLSYGEGMSLHLVADLLRNLCQLHEGDDPDRVRTQLRTTVDALLAPWDAETRATAIDVLGTLLGLAASPSSVSQAGPQVRRQALIRSLQLLLSALSTYRPAIVLLEDLHWIDQASAEVMEGVLPAIHNRHALVLATHRPGPSAPWATWPQTDTVYLNPLDEQDAVELARAVLGVMELEPELEQQIMERAGGNPFFVEELLRSMQETGALEERDGRIGLIQGAAEKLPSTLTELLLARLDQLDRPARSTAQLGSVIGRTFAVPLLARIAEQRETQLQAPLDVLERAQIAFPRYNLEREYAFKHATIREVAYNTLLLRRREALHGAAARAIIDLYPAEEYVDVIAYHFSRTREHAEAAEWLERAGDRAAAVYANDLAIEQYRGTLRRLDLVGAPVRDRARVDEKLGRILRIVARYDEALDVLESAAAVYRGADREAERRVVAEIGRVHRARGTPNDGVARVKGLLDLDEEAGPSSGLAALHVVLARLYFNLGRYKENAEAAARGSELAYLVGDERVLAEAEMSRGVALLLLGRTEDALPVMEAAVPTAEAAGEFEVLWNLLGNIALIFRDGGEFERSLEYRERASRVAEKIGDLGGQSFALASLGELHFFLGDWTQAREYLDRALAIVRPLGTSFFSMFPLALLGQLHVACGRFIEAAECLEQALALAQDGQHHQGIYRASDFLAELDLIRGDPSGALRRYDGMVDLSAIDEAGSTLTASLPILAWASLEQGDAESAASLASLAIKRTVEEHETVDLVLAQRVAGMAASRLGFGQDAECHFKQVLALARGMRYRYAEALTLYESGCLLCARGDQQGATDHLTAARDIFQHLGARPYLDRAEEALSSIGRSTHLAS